jgi:hypothetical protein
MPRDPSPTVHIIILDRLAMQTYMGITIPRVYQVKSAAVDHTNVALNAYIRHCYWTNMTKGNLCDCTS